MACTTVVCKICKHEELNTVNHQCVMCGSMNTYLEWDEADDMEPEDDNQEEEE